MRVLILEDEPIIAIDLEDIVTSGSDDVECFLAASLDGARRHIESGVDFALLDINIGHDNNRSYGIAAELMERRTPFCFVSSMDRSVPTAFENVPFVSKPFRPAQILSALPSAT
jgi:DNA-binding LytR/AlgR family response regulator